MSLLRTLDQNPDVSLDVIGTIFQAMNYDESSNLKNGKNNYSLMKELNKKKRNIEFLKRTVELMDCIRNCYIDIGLSSNASCSTKLSEIIGGNKLMKLLLPKSVSIKENYTVKGAIYRRFENFITSINEDIKYFSNELDHKLDLMHKDNKLNDETQNFEQGNTKRHQRKNHYASHQDNTYSMSNPAEKDNGMLETLHRQKLKQKRSEIHSHVNINSKSCNTKESLASEYLEFLSLMKKSYLGCDGTQVKILNGTNLVVINFDKFIDLAKIIIPNDNQ